MYIDRVIKFSFTQRKLIRRKNLWHCDAQQLKIVTSTRERILLPWAFLYILYNNISHASWPNAHFMVDWFFGARNTHLYIVSTTCWCCLVINIKATHTYLQRTPTVKTFKKLSCAELVLTGLSAGIKECTCCFDSHRSDGAICDLSTRIASSSIRIVVVSDECTEYLVYNVKSFWVVNKKINVLFAHLSTSSLCELWRRKLRQRIISSVVLWRRNPREIRISSVVDWRRMAGRELHSGGGGGRAQGLGSLGCGAEKEL